MTLIVLLILTGFLFLILEFFILPGITFAGIGGVLLIGTGVFIGYQNFGAPTGNIILAITLFLFIILFAMAFRARTWDRLMLKTEINSNVEVFLPSTIHPGDKGITTTRLNPVGKVRVNEQEVEAHCPGKFIDPKTVVEVVSVTRMYVVVKPIN